MHMSNSSGYILSGVYIGIPHIYKEEKEGVVGEVYDKTGK
jgi:hypothetical protein